MCAWMLHLYHVITKYHMYLLFTEHQPYCFVNILWMTVWLNICLLEFFLRNTVLLVFLHLVWILNYVADSSLKYNDGSLNMSNPNSPLTRKSRVIPKLHLTSKCFPHRTGMECVSLCVCDVNVCLIVNFVYICNAHVETYTNGSSSLHGPPWWMQQEVRVRSKRHNPCCTRHIALCRDLSTHHFDG